MAKGLDLEVVAEGVETQEQLSFLVSQGCDLAQGYLLSRPVDEATYRSYLLRHRGNEPASPAAADEATPV
jgi:EAL domain-containing protein (putative c-di-GMP-specific phosphodiesterase class I)